MIHHIAHACPAQRKPILLTKNTTSSLLNTTVKVFEQVKLPVGSKNDDVIPFGVGNLYTLPWCQFLRKYTVWVAATVLESPQLQDIKNSNPFEVELDVDPQHLKAAVECISSIPDVDTFDNTYYDFIKREDTTLIGFYSKDNYPMPDTIKVGSDKMDKVIRYTK